MLVPMADLLAAALAGGYAVGSFNVSNLEMIESVLRAAAACQAPVIVSTSAAEARALHPEVVQPVVETLARSFGVTCALHLDHGDSFALAVRCLRAGYTSLMFDGSHHPLQENIRLTRRVVEAAHAVGVSVEGEVGRLAGVEDDIVVDAAQAMLTDVGEAVDFVEATGVDALAVAIGNAHGFYREQPKLDFERLADIRQATNVPIVLHGGTGIDAADLARAIKLGIAKVNIASKVRRAYLHAVHTSLDEQPQTTDVLGVMRHGKHAMQKEIEAAIVMLRPDASTTR